MLNIILGMARSNHFPLGESLSSLECEDLFCSDQTL